jgi:hypothetical protein
VGLGARAGVPDLALVHRGQSLFIELKIADGVLSEAQRRMIAGERARIALSTKSRIAYFGSCSEGEFGVVVAICQTGP